MSDLKFVSIDRIFSKIDRDLTSEFSETDVVEWCGEALEFMEVPKMFEEAVAFMEVKDHQCVLPVGTHAIIQIARNNRWNGPQDNEFCPKNIAASIQATNPESPAIPVRIDCKGMPVDAYDIAYYRPFYDLKAEYLSWAGSTYYSHYTPVRLKTGSFFDSLVCQDTSGHGYGTDEYTIIQGEVLRFNFRSGSVAIAYLRQIVDPETGYPMVPDHISYTTAITKYVTKMMFSKRCYAGRDGACTLADRAEAEWNWYCGQAGAYGMMLRGVDEYQNMLDQRQYILPRNHKYYGFFGKLAAPEHRKFNDPDYRNRTGLLYNSSNRTPGGLY